ncbi:MAG: hypothetical protein WBQ73_00185, partial [Candidatus Babeliales bacterium]
MYELNKIIKIFVFLTLFSGCITTPGLPSPLRRLGLRAFKGLHLKQLRDTSVQVSNKFNDWRQTSPVLNFFSARM